MSTSSPKLIDITAPIPPKRRVADAFNGTYKNNLLQYCQFADLLICQAVPASLHAVTVRYHVQVFGKPGFAFCQ